MTLANTGRPAESGEAATGGVPPEAGTVPRRRPSIGAGAAVGTILAVATAGAVWLTLPHGDPHPGHGTAARPTVPVGYAVTGSGTARITYTRPDGTSRSLSVRLPWQQTAELAAKGPASVAVVLGPEGGHATCALTLHGTAVQHATAYGAYGRATCTSAAPAP
ncbi:hypothetical protein SAMN05216267_1010101 [Actinacidiphila rubida]|uniref:MmpS family membrane protein n=1 Tax=Actinacidiphila rubida TaxID=310780 RepID=A0A1H8JHB7_9ACTN|nr:hypothetical protein [Actinacidiphila rubida]SEN79696.1 hypothetical protein SAMN05216267_1010101 [Actinacidiphila rubida]